MDYIITHQPMYSGRADAERRKYHKYDGKKPGSVWLVADQPNAGDNIYYCDFDPKSQGYGGSTLKFMLVDDTVIDLPAPWHSNSDALFTDTGVDVRDKHLTYVVIGMDNKYNPDTVVDVIYQDKEPTVGAFERGDDMAKSLANKLGKPVYAYRQSQGGSSMGQVRPDSKETTHG